MSYSGANYIVTNYHVAGTTSNLTVTFSNGDSYPAKIIGSDPYSDLAIVSVQAPSSEFYPLTLATSSSLRVGDSVVAIRRSLRLDRFNDRGNREPARQDDPG